MVMRDYDISEQVNVEDNFSDAGDKYYTSYLATAKKLGLSASVGNSMFAPDRAISRQEMFALLYNTLKQIGELPTSTTAKTLTDYSDENEVASWAKNKMTLFVETETISDSGGKLESTGTTNRAEMAQVLDNLMEKK